MYIVYVGHVSIYESVVSKHFARCIRFECKNRTDTAYLKGYGLDASMLTIIDKWYPTQSTQTS